MAGVDIMPQILWLKAKSPQKWDERGPVLDVSIGAELVGLQVVALAVLYRPPFVLGMSYIAQASERGSQAAKLANGACPARCRLRDRLAAVDDGALNEEVRTITKRFFASLSRTHSHLNAIIGSTFVARRAGSQQASSATPASNVATMTKVTGSVTLTPNTKLLTNRVNAKAASKPRAMPINANLIPCPMTSFSTSRCCAPSAIRMPISCVRCVTA